MSWLKRNAQHIKEVCVFVGFGLILLGMFFTMQRIDSSTSDLSEDVENNHNQSTEFMRCLLVLHDENLELSEEATEECRNAANVVENDASDHRHSEDEPGDSTEPDRENRPVKTPDNSNDKPSEEQDDPSVIDDVTDTLDEVL